MNKVRVLDIQLDYSDVVIVPRPSRFNSRKDVCLESYIKVGKSGHQDVLGIPVMNANMSTVGTFEVVRAMLKDGMFATIHKHYTKEEVVEFLNSIPESDCRRVFVTIGLRDEFLNINDLTYILEKAPTFNVCIDVPNAYIKSVIDLTKKVSKALRGYSSLLMVGNVCNSSGTGDLFDAGADIVKVGIAPGSKCRTRMMTGVARPQLSAVMACAEIAKSYTSKKYICADGGIQNPGDIAKAFVGGADFVMCGSMYAGTDEAAGPIITKCFRTNEYEIEWLWDDIADIPIQSNTPDKPKYEFKKYKQYYGMASKTAQDKFYGGVADYKTSEGADGLVEYVGSVHDVNLQICGGLRSTLTYCDSQNITELQEKGYFYRVNNPHISQIYN